MITSSEVQPKVEVLLEVKGLNVSYRTSRSTRCAVQDVSFSVGKAEVVAIVGESGSGKSTTAHAIMRLLPTGGYIESGEILFNGDDLTLVPSRQVQRYRGRAIGLIPQDPGVALNPVKKVGEQVAEVFRIHRICARQNARQAAVVALREVGLDRPELRAEQYPHQLSGGMRQRVLVAIAMAANPSLIIADEPTSALDVTVQKRVLDRLEALQQSLGTAMLLITHDIGVAADRSARVVVMRGGRVVEAGPTEVVLSEPRHPYTRELLRSVPGLTRHRRRWPVASGGGGRPELLRVTDLTKSFASGIRAVESVSFSVKRGSTLAIVGESGSGKSTTARMVASLERPTSGHIEFQGIDVAKLGRKERRQLRQKIQLVYQNPYSSLDPRWSVGRLVAEGLVAFGIGSAQDQRRRVATLIDRVGLPRDIIERKARELSGGQRQRVAIARALALDPELLVLDEPVSALDVTVQMQILDLLAELQAVSGFSYLFISHDLAVVREVADEVAVMSNGHIVETGPTNELFDKPAHEYTRDLLRAIPGSQSRAV